MRRPRGAESGFAQVLVMQGDLSHCRGEDSAACAVSPRTGSRGVGGVRARDAVCSPSVGFPETEKQADSLARRATVFKDQMKSVKLKIEARVFKNSAQDAKTGTS